MHLTEICLRTASTKINLQLALLVKHINKITKRDGAITDDSTDMISVKQSQILDMIKDIHYCT